MELRLEVRGLDLGEVTELADEEHDEGRRYLLPVRARLLQRRLASTLLLFDRFGHEEQIRTAGQEEQPDDQVLPVRREKREERSGPDCEPHLDGQRERRAD